MENCKNLNFKNRSTQKSFLTERFVCTALPYKVYFPRWILFPWRAQGDCSKWALAVHGPHAIRHSHVLMLIASLFQQQCTTQVLQAIWQMSCNNSGGARALQQASHTVHIPNDWRALHESSQQCTRPYIHPPLCVYRICAHKHIHTQTHREPPPHTQRLTLLPAVVHLYWCTALYIKMWCLQ